MAIVNMHNTERWNQRMAIVNMHITHAHIHAHAHPHTFIQVPTLRTDTSPDGGEHRGRSRGTRWGDPRPGGRGRGEGGCGGVICTYQNTK